MLDNLRVASPKPGHPERIHSPTPAAVTQQKPVRTFDRFLKINVRHITDGQVSFSNQILYGIFRAPD